ncbi:MAG: hypothetical protein JNK35_10065 [Phycisphaerae bacterium]|nr:hypothetical protein [Phycisphaerae bacterium]
MPALRPRQPPFASSAVAALALTIAPGCSGDGDSGGLAAARRGVSPASSPAIGGTSGISVSYARHLALQVAKGEKTMASLTPSERRAVAAIASTRSD